MKKCPFCAEEIQNEAIKCKHCGEWLNKDVQMPAPDEINKNEVETQKLPIQEVELARSDEELIVKEEEISSEIPIWKVMAAGAIIGVVLILPDSPPFVIGSAFGGAILFGALYRIARLLYKVRPEGIGGLLLFFIISLIILNPLISLSTIEDYKKVSKYFNILPGLKTLMVIDLTIGIPLIIFGIVAGIMLIKIKHDAVKIAKIFLVTNIIFYSSETLYYLIYYFQILLGGLNYKIFGEVINSSLRHIRYSVIWYLYLILSIRVRNTFPIL